MREILRWFHAENERHGINPLTQSVTVIPDNVYSTPVAWAVF